MDQMHGYSTNKCLLTDRHINDKLSLTLGKHWNRTPLGELTVMSKPHSSLGSPQTELTGHQFMTNI